MSFESTVVLSGMLLFILGIPLALKLVPPNPVYGVRTSKTFSSRDVWFAANRPAGINMAITGFVIAVTALVVPRLIPDYSEGARRLIIAAIVISAIAIWLARTLWQVFRL
jgi:uncharacterized membrane protein